MLLRLCGQVHASQHHEFSKIENYVTISIGASFYNSNSDVTKLELLLKADETLYSVKNSGRNNFAILEV